MTSSVATALRRSQEGADGRALQADKVKSCDCAFLVDAPGLGFRRFRWIEACDRAVCCAHEAVPVSLVVHIASRNNAVVGDELWLGGDVVCGIEAYDRAAGIAHKTVIEAGVGVDIRSRYDAAPVDAPRERWQS